MELTLEVDDDSVDARVWSSCCGSKVSTSLSGDQLPLLTYERDEWPRTSKLVVELVLAKAFGHIISVIDEHSAKILLFL